MRSPHFILCAVFLTIGASLAPAGEPQKSSTQGGTVVDRPKQELDEPITATVIAKEKEFPDLGVDSERFWVVRITNPNPYTVSFRARRYRDSILPIAFWEKNENDKWMLYGFDWCGTGVESVELAAGASMDVVVKLLDQPKQQRILSRFYKKDSNDIYSQCVLAELRSTPTP